MHLLQELQAMAALHMAVVMGALLMVLGMAVTAAAVTAAATIVPAHTAALMVVGTAAIACMEAQHMADLWVAPCMVQVLMVVDMAAVTVGMVPEP